MTTLDPHPINILMKDGTEKIDSFDGEVKVYSNVLFADNYYQFAMYVPNGQPVDGAYNRFLGSSLGATIVDALPGGYSTALDGAQHADVHLWYHGTIDTSESAFDGPIGTQDGEFVTPEMRNTWWTALEDGGKKAGFHYSRLGGGDRLSMSSPPLKADKG